MWVQGRGARTLCSFCVEREPFRFWEMELPRNQLSCVATRGAPRLLRCFGDDSGDALGERLASIESCSRIRDRVILCLSNAPHAGVYNTSQLGDMIYGEVGSHLAA